MIRYRELRREEIETVWSIDRSEVIENIYILVDGKLVLEPDYFDMHGWPPSEAERYTTLLLDCFDRGGWCYGAFDEDRLIGAAILDSKFIGESKNLLQLKFLHVSHRYRGQGIGGQLFELAKTTASQRRAKGLYISATPSENTIDFYLGLGCEVTRVPDPELLALEPEDIHLECAF